MSSINVSLEHVVQTVSRVPAAPQHGYAGGKPTFPENAGRLALEEFHNVGHGNCRGCRAGQNRSDAGAGDQVEAVLDPGIEGHFDPGQHLCSVNPPGAAAVQRQDAEAIIMVHILAGFHHPGRNPMGVPNRLSRRQHALTCRAPDDQWAYPLSCRDAEEKDGRQRQQSRHRKRNQRDSGIGSYDVDQEAPRSVRSARRLSPVVWQPPWRVSKDLLTKRGGSSRSPRITSFDRRARTTLCYAPCRERSACR